MEQLETTLRTALLALSRMLDPAMALLTRLDFSIRQQLGQIGVPYNWTGAIVTTVWVIVVLMLLRVLPNWIRIIALLLLALIAMKSYGILPS